MAGTEANIMVGPVAVYYGVAGEAPTLSMGYTSEDGVDFTPDVGMLDVKVGEKKSIVKQIPISDDSMLSMTLIEPTLANIARVIPGAVIAGGLITMPSEGTEATPISMKLVGLNPDGIARVITALYAQGRMTGAMKLSARELAAMPVEFKILGQGTNLYTIQDGGGAEAVTLSSGAFARTAGQSYYRVAGEGGAADVLDDITGTSLTNNELLILQIADAADPITLTHLADTLELTGAVDWIMASLDDVIWLRYSTTGSKWVEVGRFDARSS